MREILFRGKTDKGEWAEGDLFQVFDDGFFIHDRRCHSVKVIPETIGQYTGLTDKNGKKIFEGDIITDTIDVFVVVFDEYCRFMITNSKSNYLLAKENYDCIVLGNIHDNPELLGGAE